jgi:hypothetical protein
MNKTQFTDILHHPDAVTEQTLPELMEIIKEYPFFQLGRMLLLKNLYKLDHIRYNSELKYSAAFIPDRSKLYMLLHHSGVDDQDAEVVEPEMEKEHPNVDAHESKPGGDEINNQERNKHNTSSKPSVTITDNYLDASDDFTDENGNVFTFKAKQDASSDKEINDLDDIVLPAADLLDYEVTSSAGYQLPNIDDVENMDPCESRSFSDWLHIMRYSTPGESKDSQKEKKKGMDLINNFLNAETQIIPSTTRKPKDIDLSEKKEDNPDDILTETLADIYIKQGHKSKAIAIFEKLRLKYPEKNVYFARRISDLNEN